MSTSRSAGFTLLELLVVLVIMALGISIVATRLDQVVPGVGVKAETRKVAALLRHARSQAVLLNQVTLIRLVENPAGLAFGDDPQIYYPPADIHLQLSGGSGRGESEEAGQQVTGIRFFPEGHASGGSIGLSGEGGGRATISVDRLTGRVSIDG